MNKAEEYFKSTLPKDFKYTGTVIFSDDDKGHSIRHNIFDLMEAFLKHEVNDISDEEANYEFIRLEQWCLDNDKKAPSLDSFVSGFKYFKQLLKQ